MAARGPVCARVFSEQPPYCFNTREKEGKKEKKQQPRTVERGRGGIASAGRTRTRLQQTLRDGGGTGGHRDGADKTEDDQESLSVRTRPAERATKRPTAGRGTSRRSARAPAPMRAPNAEHARALRSPGARAAAARRRVRSPVGLARRTVGTPQNVRAERVCRGLRALSI